MSVRPAASLRQDVDQCADGLVGNPDNRRTGPNFLFGLQQIDDIAGEVTIRALARDVVRCSIQPVYPGVDPSQALVDGTQHGHTPRSGNRHRPVKLESVCSVRDYARKWSASQV